MISSPRLVLFEVHNSKKLSYSKIKNRYSKTSSARQPKKKGFCVAIFGFGLIKPFIYFNTEQKSRMFYVFLNNLIFFQTQNLAPSPCGLFRPWHPLKALVKTFHFFVFWLRKCGSTVGYYQNPGIFFSSHLLGFVSRILIIWIFLFPGTQHHYHFRSRSFGQWQFKQQQFQWKIYSGICDRPTGWPARWSATADGPGRWKTAPPDRREWRQQ